MLQFLCLQMCVYGPSAVPRGGGGGSLPWGGEGQGGGDTSLGGSLWGFYCICSHLWFVESFVPRVPGLEEGVMFWGYSIGIGGRNIDLNAGETLPLRVPKKDGIEMALKALLPWVPNQEAARQNPYRPGVSKMGTH